VTNRSSECVDRADILDASLVGELLSDSLYPFSALIELGGETIADGAIGVSPGFLVPVTGVAGDRVQYAPDLLFGPSLRHQQSPQSLGMADPLSP
jgi:hypothetical protein